MNTDGNFIDEIMKQKPEVKGPCKIVMRAENADVRVMPLEKGDVLSLLSEDHVKIGQKYKNYNAIISRIYYEPKKWWQFWKKKKQIGFQVTWQ